MTLQTLYPPFSISVDLQQKKTPFLLYSVHGQLVVSRFIDNASSSLCSDDVISLSPITPIQNPRSIIRQIDYDHNTSIIYYSDSFRIRRRATISISTEPEDLGMTSSLHHSMSWICTWHCMDVLRTSFILRYQSGFWEYNSWHGSESTAALTLCAAE